MRPGLPKTGKGSTQRCSGFNEGRIGSPNGHFLLILPELSHKIDLKSANPGYPAGILDD
jgi:hypothetical protein